MHILSGGSVGGEGLGLIYPTPDVSEDRYFKSMTGRDGSRPRGWKNERRKVVDENWVIEGL